VRTRRGDAMGRAAESLTPRKGARISAAADAYCQANPDGAEERRIDVIAVDLTPQGRLLSVQHIKNAFSGDELPELPSR
jgi:Holliday junction resolvase-like predicted endonuclease